MSYGLKASDWTVEHAGDEGTVACAEYLGRFRVDKSGIIRITWSTGPSWNGKKIGRAAYEAIEAAIRPQSGS
jgi:hypothetical protein